jgi:hypothetical protein
MVRGFTTGIHFGRQAKHIPGQPCPKCPDVAASGPRTKASSCCRQVLFLPERTPLPRT